MCAEPGFSAYLVLDSHQCQDLNPKMKYFDLTNSKDRIHHLAVLKCQSQRTLGTRRHPQSFCQPIHAIQQLEEYSSFIQFLTPTHRLYFLPSFFDQLCSSNSFKLSGLVPRQNLLPFHFNFGFTCLGISRGCTGSPCCHVRQRFLH